MNLIHKLVYSAIGIVAFGFTFACIGAAGILIMVYVNPVIGFAAEIVGLGGFTLKVMRMKS